MKKDKTACDLKTCFLCKLCLPEWLPAVGVHRQNIPFKKNELIFREGDEVAGIYFVYKGKVKVHKHWEDDKELIVRFAKEGDILGHRGLGKLNIYPVSATALEPGIVCFISFEFFRASLKVNNDFSYKLLMFYAEELQESEKRMRNLAHMSAKGRIASALLLLQEKFGVEQQGFIDIALSRQDIASYAGTTYETVFRVMSELVQEGMIKVAEKKIAILNYDGLASLVKE